MSITRREERTVPRPADSHFTDPQLERVFGHIYKHLIEPTTVVAEVGDTITNIINETVPAEHPQYYDRGDPATPDWTEADLTMDNTWRDLDLTTVNANIAGATLVILRVGMSTLAGSPETISFRENGNSNEWNVVSFKTDYATAGEGDEYMTMPVTPDENGRIEYKVTPTPVNVDITVAGWWSGYGTSGGGASSEIALNSAHRTGDGSDHADVATNSAHSAGDGTDHSAISTGHPHQDVTTSGEPEFVGVTVTDYFNGPENTMIVAQSVSPPGPIYRSYRNSNAWNAANRIDLRYELRNSAETYFQTLMLRVDANDYTAASEDSHVRWFTFEGGLQDDCFGMWGHDCRFIHDVQILGDLDVDTDANVDGDLTVVGDADIDGTCEADAYSANGSAGVDATFSIVDNGGTSHDFVFTKGILTSYGTS